MNTKFKKCKVIILRTENREYAPISKNYKSELFTYHKIKDITHDKYKDIYHHIYILAKEPIKRFDWYYDEGNPIQQFDAGKLVYGSSMKVIASTNKSLGLPLVPEYFIKDYCLENGINKILVEFSEIEENKYYLFCTDNEINIQPVKSNWNKEEVIKLLSEFNIYAEVGGKPLKVRSVEQFDNWVKTNL